VSTQLTTKSDLVAAAAAARAAVLRQRRYAGLTPMQYLDGADMSMLLHEAGLGGAREKTKIGKQVRGFLLCKSESIFIRCTTGFLSYFILTYGNLFVLVY